MLVVSIMNSFRSLFFLMVLMLVMTYVFSVMVTQVVTAHKLSVGLDDMQGEQSVLEEYYGTLEKSMLILYQMIASGVDWGDAADPLSRYCSWCWNVVFMLYMAFVMFAMMNVVTALVVESALRNADEDKKMLL